MNLRNDIHRTLLARLMGTCFISVTAGGPVVSGPGALSVTAGAEVVAENPTVTSEQVADPGAPVTQPTPEEAAAEEVRRDALTQVERDAEDAAKLAKDKPATEEEKPKEAVEWDKRDKTKDVPLSPEQDTEINTMAGLDDTQKAAMKEFTLESNTTGTLSEASRDKAAELWKVSRAMVDNYVKGIEAANARVKTEAPKPGELSADQKAQLGLRMDALYKEAGTKENWELFSAWATGGGMTEAEQVELAQAIDVSPSLGAMAAKAALTKWQESGAGGGPRDVSRGGVQDTTPKAGDIKGFANKSQQDEALNARDSMGRFKMDSDPGYRAGVEQKMAVSDFSKSSVEQSFYKGAMM